jgi:hypothetical protein
MIFEQCLSNLPEEPTFSPCFFRDRNPLSGTRKTRKLYRPNDAMRTVHARLIRYLRPFTRRFPHATGSLPKRSPLTNVRPHRKRRFFYVLDLRNAYQNVDITKLAEILCTVDPALSEQREALHAFLERYCSATEGGLATGAPASPDLFNLYAGKLLDELLAPLCKRYGLTYTRYLDDLTFSSRDRCIGRHRRRAIRAVITAAGFTVHDRKVGVYDLKKGPIVITGVGLEYGGRIFLPRSYTRRIRGLIHKALQGFPISPAKIHGMMGVFRSMTDLRDMNRLERKLLGAYRKYQRRERAVA